MATRGVSPGRSLVIRLAQQTQWVVADRICERTKDRDHTDQVDTDVEAVLAELEAEWPGLLERVKEVIREDAHYGRFDPLEKWQDAPDL